MGNFYLIIRIVFFMNQIQLFCRFHVRPPTYYQKCRDLQRYLSSMLQKHARYLNIIKDFTEVLRIFIAALFLFAVDFTFYYRR